MTSRLITHPTAFPEGAQLFIVNGEMAFLYLLDGSLHLWYTYEPFVDFATMNEFLSNATPEQGASQTGTMAELLEGLAQ